MSQKSYRETETPEEIRFKRITDQNRRILCTLILCFFVSILVWVPKEPNSLFYTELDTFLNTYLFGYVFPDFSDKFYFSMKVAWCLSLLYQLVIAFLIFLLIKYCLGYEGVLVMLYLAKYDTFTVKMRIAMPILSILIILSQLMISIVPYAFESNSPLTILRSFGDFFYGDYVKASLLFLSSQIIILIGCYTILLNLYYYFFVGNDLHVMKNNKSMDKLAVE